MSSWFFIKIIRTGRTSTTRFLAYYKITYSTTIPKKVGLTAVNIIGTPLEKADSQNVFNLDGDVWSLYDDLSFLMYTDVEVAQLINKLERKKFEAVATERFEYAKKIKSAISMKEQSKIISKSIISR